MLCEWSGCGSMLLLYVQSSPTSGLHNHEVEGGGCGMEA